MIMTIARKFKENLDRLSKTDIESRVSWFSSLLCIKKKVELVDQFISRVSYEDCEIELREVYRYTFDDGSSLTLVGESTTTASAHID